MNLKRRVLDNKIAADPVDLEGTLDEAIRDLRDMKDNFYRKGEWSNLRLVMQCEDFGENQRLVLVGSRPETNEEFSKRVAQAKRKATITRRNKAFPRISK